MYALDHQELLSMYVYSRISEILEVWEHYPNPHLIELRAWAEKYAQNNLLSLTVDWNEILEEQWGEEMG